MPEKRKRRLFQLAGFLIGLAFGWIRPLQMQSMLPILGIGVGVGYFIFSQTATDNERPISEISWFIPLQMVMYFIIGGAITSSLYLVIELYTNGMIGLG
ncbi:hypothetical protein [Alkalibacterium sp. MB6]|uniref:hypothetical protein n=1 Tax=Alkalibacterium sp. MB6 TaxID=2081965 RepID=UPI00137B2D8E|nr:hypothetical protein [Alkalibacterium sp. MB6]